MPNIISKLKGCCQETCKCVDSLVTTRIGYLHRSHLSVPVWQRGKPLVFHLYFGSVLELLGPSSPISTLLSYDRPSTIVCCFDYPKSPWYR